MSESAPSVFETEGRRLSVPTRVAFVVCCIVFVAVFQLCYIYVISQIWEYAGLTFVAPPLAYWVAFTCVAIIPSAWIPLTLERPSQFFYLYLYVALFIPSCLVPLFCSADWGLPPAELIPLVLTLLLSFWTIGMIYFIPVLKVPRISVPPIIWRFSLIAALITASVIVFRVFGTTLRLAGDTQILEQRLLGRETFATVRYPLVVGYAMNWPAYALNPLLVALGMWTNRRWMLALGLLGQLYAYSVIAARGSLVTILLASLVWLSLKQRRVSFAVFWMITFVSIPTLALIARAFASIETQVFGSWVFLRGFVGTGYLTGIYFRFFSHHELTLFTQVRGLGWLGQNPYSTTLGFVIGQSLGQPQNNANASFWADGYASFGLLGIVTVSVVVAIVFFVVDSVLRDRDLRVAATALAPQVTNLVDLSIFTTFLGGGMGLLVLLLYLMPNVSHAASVFPWRLIRRAKLAQPLGVSD